MKNTAIEEMTKRSQELVAKYEKNGQLSKAEEEEAKALFKKLYTATCDELEKAKGMLNESRKC